MKTHELISTSPFLKSVGQNLSCGQVKDQLEKAFADVLGKNPDGKMILRPDRIFSAAKQDALLLRASHYIDIRDTVQLSQWLALNAQVHEINSIWVSLSEMS